MASPGVVTVRILGDAGGLKRTLNDVDGHVSKVGGAFKGLALAAGGLFAAAGIGGLAKSAVSEALEAQKVAKLTDAVVKSTGGAANVTSEHVGKLADKLSVLAGVDDEVIASSQNVLLTFTKVRNEVGKGNDIFDQATLAALDMSAALGTDLQGATLQLGKALNDPVKGVTALTRAGVSFTQQQKDQIKAMVAAGDTLGAQKLILSEMQTQFGGAAAAAASPFDKLRVTIGNLQEKIGLALLPVLQKAAEWLSKHLPAALTATGRVLGPIIKNIGMFWKALTTGFTKDEGTGVERVALMLREYLLPVIEKVVAFMRDHWKPILIAVGAALGVLAGAGVIGAVIGAVTALAAALASPVVALALVVAAVVYAYQRFEWFRDAVAAVAQFLTETWERHRDRIMEILTQLGEMFTAAFGAVQAIVMTAVSVLTELWDRFGSGLVDNLQRYLGGILEAVQGAFTILTGIFDLIKAILTGKWGEAWDAIKQIVDGAWQAINGIVTVAIESVRIAIETAMGLISAAWSLAWNSLKTVLSDIWEGIKGIVGAAVKWVLDKIDTMLGPLDEIIAKIGKAGLNNELRNRDPNAPPLIPGGRGGTRGFAHGGVVPGRLGMPVLATVHGGERILTPAQQRNSGTRVVVQASVVRPGDFIDGYDILRKLIEVQRQSGPLELEIA